ncbi:MAG TPA: hypothetical protein VEI49_04590 [Terriglobales bacterium]|nr:hypothetical protein [Terriglobales bacterium]HXY13118.1 hypothetical protein [Terriglobales bacterium]
MKHIISRRYAGFFISGDWFCGPDCFEQVVRSRILALLSAQGQHEQPPSLRMPLGLLLVSREVLTTEQLRVVLDRQRVSGANIGDIVQELGFGTQEQITAAVATQWSCPVFSLQGRQLPTQIQIPLRLLELYEMLPVHFSPNDRKLLVAFVSRVHYHILHTIEYLTQCVADPCFITPGDYHRYLKSVASSVKENQALFERSSSPAEIAHLVRNYAHQFAAEEARFGLCRDYLWARIRGGVRQMDLLFRVQSIQ